jgi:hypothetical protein
MSHVAWLIESCGEAGLYSYSAHLSRGIIRQLELSRPTMSLAYRQRHWVPDKAEQ